MVVVLAGFEFFEVFLTRFLFYLCSSVLLCSFIFLQVDTLLVFTIGNPSFTTPRTTRNVFINIDHSLVLVSILE